MATYDHGRDESVEELLREEIKRLQECSRVLGDVPLELLQQAARYSMYSGDGAASDTETEIGGWIKRRQEALTAVDAAKATEAAKGE